MNDHNQSEKLEQHQRPVTPTPASGNQELANRERQKERERQEQEAKRKQEEEQKRQQEEAARKSGQPVTAN